MASGLRARLRAMNTDTPSVPKPVVRQSGLLIYTERRDLEEGLFSLDPAGLRRMGCDGRTFDIRKCLFLDTETTGLSGGAGTVAFLVGIGFVEDDHFTIEQYLMRDYSDEPDLIDRLANRMDAFETVCTFNGRTFDMPLLEARFTMSRMRNRWRELPNLDLLIPTRRVWKLRLRSCKLARIEEIIFGQPRDHDLPGSEVPQRYFEFLKSGKLELLEDIVEHNRQDIATLATLLVRLNTIYAQPLRELKEKKDVYSVGKALEGQGELRPAKELYRVSAVPSPSGTLDALTGDTISESSNWRLYQIARRANNLDEMRQILDTMRSRKQMPYAVEIEYSKLFEHKLRRPDKALECANTARMWCPCTEKDALEKRIIRLQKKLK